MNILVIVPRFAEKGKYYNFPYGLGYVSASLKQAGFNVSCLNLCHEADDLKPAISKSITRNNIDIVCTGGMSIHWELVDNVLNVIKEINPDITTIVGGALVTSDVELALENMQIDYGVIGEGEETIVELMGALCDNTEALNIQSTAHRDSNNVVIINESRPPISDLDSIPFPDYEGLGFGDWLEIDEILKGGITGLLYDYDKPQYTAEISASRSCPFKCTFCFHPLGNKYRQRSLDNVFKEIEYLQEKYKINSLLILDELFSSNEERIIEFTERIKKTGLPWSAQWRADNINEHILKTLKDSNVCILGIGVESMSDTVLSSMKKRTTKAEIERAFKMCENVGVRCGGNIILGDVAETMDTIHESVSWWEEHPEYDINMRHIIAIPNSPIWQHALKNGLIKNKLEFIKAGFPVINLTSIPDKEFFGNKNKLDIEFILNKKLLSGDVLKSEIIDTNSENKPVYQFDVNCPRCAKISTYKYSKWSDLPYSVVLCKHCNKKLKISTRKIVNGTLINEILSVIMLYFYAYYWVYFRKYEHIRRVVSFVRKLMGVKV